MTHPPSERQVSSSRVSAQLPYARPAMSPVDYEPPAEASEPAIKKKRKRADARQLEALNSTYGRTAFPSTEERAQLAKDLDMSARSVQIWLEHALVLTVLTISEP
jgi:homeobox protein YOX1/YHP1